MKPSSLLREIAPELGLYLVNSINPFRIEGQKTIVAELLEQRAWRPPDYIVVPGGNLGNSSAIGKGLRELKELGLIEKVPHIVIVQAAGANPFYQTLRAGSPDLLAVDDPQHGSHRHSHRPSRQLEKSQAGAGLGGRVLRVGDG